MAIKKRGHKYHPGLTVARAEHTTYSPHTYGRCRADGIKKDKPQKEGIKTMDKTERVSILKIKTGIIP